MFHLICLAWFCPSEIQFQQLPRSHYATEGQSNVKAVYIGRGGRWRGIDLHPWNFTTPPQKKKRMAGSWNLAQASSEPSFWSLKDVSFPVGGGETPLHHHMDT